MVLAKGMLHGLRKNSDSSGFWEGRGFTGCGATACQDSLPIASSLAHEDSIRQALEGLDVLIFLAAQVLLRRIIAGHRELENGTMAGLRLDPDLAAMALDDLLANCQTNSVARVLGPGVQALEYNKDI